jgi:hypothetical protein
VTIVVGIMAQNARSARFGRPGMTISLPPKFDASVPVESEFLTPPIWVASNPPPVFERPEMKRTMSEVSNWAGDEEEEEEEDGSTSSEQPKQEDEREASKESVRVNDDVMLMAVTTTGKTTRSKSADILHETKIACPTSQ